MLPDIRKATIVSAMVLVATLLSVSESSAQVQEFALATEILYYECVNPPEEPRCISTTQERQGEACPRCEMWAQRTLRARWNAQLNTGQYSFEVPPFFPRANYFGKDVAEQIYQVSFPQTAAGHPVTSNTLYVDHEQFLWFEVHEAGGRVGTLAVTPTLMGFVVSDDDSVQVLYPSSILEGDLTVGDTRHVMRGEPVKYLVPEGIFVNDAIALLIERVSPHAYAVQNDRGLIRERDSRQQPRLPP